MILINLQYVQTCAEEKAKDITHITLRDGHQVHAPGQLTKTVWEAMAAGQKYLLLLGPGETDPRQYVEDGNVAKQG